VAEGTAVVMGRVVRALRSARSPAEASEGFVASLEVLCGQRVYAVFLARSGCESLEPVVWRGRGRRPDPLPMGLDPLPFLRRTAGLGPADPLRMFPLYLDTPGRLLGFFACGGAPCPHCVGSEPLCESLSDVLTLHLQRAEDLAGALEREARAVDLQRAVVESLPMAVALCDDQCRLLTANRMFREACGGSAEAGTPVTLLLPAGALEGVDLGELLDKALRGHPTFRPRVRLIGSRGSPRVVSLWLTPLRDGCLTPGTLLALYDVTREARTEDALSRAQRMESLGRLASGLAHEFKNLLMTIQGNAELLHLHGGLEVAGRERVDRILSACAQASELAYRVLAFGRGSRPRAKPLRLGELAARVAELARAALPKGVEFWLPRDPGPVVEVDPSSMEQVLLNLLLNAGEAAGRAGTVAVRVGSEPGRAWFEVEDDGPGMPRQVAEQAFEPFFTTKEEGGGTGLGLAVAYGIVRDHGGEIELDTAPGRGCRFRVWLPLDQPPGGVRTPRSP